MRAALSQIGRYRVEEKVGAGGMAAVYKGVLQGAEGFERRVAIKVLHPHLCDEEDYVRMFRDEARLASRLSHPSLVPVIDLGAADGIHYMVMDFVEGETLADLRARYKKKKMPFPVGHALWILSKVLEGLHYAHELTNEDGSSCGIVHRDVSPKNIVISRSGAVRLVDFGIARNADSGGKTQAGVIKGTLPYMPPEQARGESIDHRADLFAVGMVLYELLTDELPIDTANTEVQQRALAENKININTDKIDLKLRPIVAQALACNADERFESADTFATTLHSILEELNPEYEPAKLAGLAGSRSIIRKRKNQRKKRAQKAESTQAGSSLRAIDSGSIPAAVDMPLPPWDGPRTIAMFATAILVSAMLYTFISGI